MNKLIKKNKFYNLFLKQKIGIFLLILSIFLIIISIILFWTANFKDYYNIFIGNGFTILKYYGIINLFYNWNQLNIDAAKNIYISHPYEQIYYGIIILFILVPFCLILGNILFFWGWWKSKI